MAIDYSLKAYCGSLRHKHIRIMSDNTTAIAGINKQGSTHSSECQSIAKEIWLWALARGLWLSAAHIPGIENVEADHASRVFQDELEWSLCSREFNCIVNQFGKPEMDLFASHLNYRVMPFCSYHPDPLAHVIDAFTISWTNMVGYAFPPFCLLGRVLQKIVQDKAMCIVVAPEWPKKSWFSMFKNLCT
jgi:hypothetical protein